MRRRAMGHMAEQSGAGGILAEAALWRGAETSRRLIAEGTSPKLFDAEVSASALHQPRTGDHGMAVRDVGWPDDEVTGYNYDFGVYLE
jgi:hypothetical protein